VSALFALAVPAQRTIRRRGLGDELTNNLSRRSEDTVRQMLGQSSHASILAINTFPQSDAPAQMIPDIRPALLGGSKLLDHCFGTLWICRQLLPHRRFGRAS
jgi:hypothetical protein